MILVTDHGLRPNDPDFDNSPPFDALVATLPRPLSTLQFPSGTFTFKTRPRAIQKRLSLVGEGVNGTSLSRAFKPASYADALFRTICSIRAEGFGVVAADGTSDGSAFYLSGVGASGSVLRDLYITGKGSGTWAIPIVLHSGDALGIRTCYLQNLELFAATIHILWAVNARGLTLDSVQGYPAGGSSDRFVIQGAKTADGDAGHSDNVIITTRYLQTLYLYSVRGAVVTSTNNTRVIADANCSGVRVL